MTPKYTLERRNVYRGAELIATAYTTEMAVLIERLLNAHDKPHDDDRTAKTAR